MLVLSALPDMLRHRLQDGATAPFQLVPVVSWADAVAAILREPIEIAVVDPALEADARTHEVERFRVLFPSLPIILYTRFSPAIAPVLLRLGNAEIRRVILAWHDDHPSQIREALFGESGQAVLQVLMRDLSDLLARCPERLRWALETIIREPAEMQTVQALAERAQIDRRTCVRWFARAHLPSPSVMLMVLRVVYAHRLLQDPGYTVEDVAYKLGFAQTRTFSQNVKEVFGMTPGEIRVSLGPDHAIDIIRERYLAGARETQPAPTLRTAHAQRAR